MALGPLEYFVIGFEGNHFTGEIWPEMRAIQAKGIVRLIDLAFVKKDADGTLSLAEVSDLSDAEARVYKDVAPNIQGLMTAEDVALLAADLPAGSSAAVALLEHTWAISLRDTIKRANGRLLSVGMVSPDTVEAVENELASAGAVLGN